MVDMTQKYGGKPFGEAVSFFKQKLNIPTKRWDDLWQEQHAKGFMVAGAMKADLLTDLRNSVGKAITDGETLADFRNRFDDIIQRHGWSYKGGRNWRTRVIFETNFRTAYAAGRYKQMKDPDVTKLRPYWMYRHGDSKNPRLAHLALDGKILPHDDPWWNSYYPPNGWGCRCRVVTLSQRDLEKMGREGPDKSPEIQYETIEDDVTGKQYKVPVGIDPGWNYNVGQAGGQGFKALTDKFEKLPNDVARAWMGPCLQGPAFKRFFDGQIDGDFPVAVLATADQTVLEAQVQTVWLSRETLDIHKKKHPEIGLSDYQKIPEILDTGEVYKQGDTRLVYLQQGEKLYLAALKRTGDAKENYFLTLFETDPKRADRQVRDTLERVR